MADDTPQASKPQKRPHSILLAEEGANCFSERYEAAVLLGLNKLHCAAHAGCDESSVSGWERQAAKDREQGIESEYTRFIGRVRKAKAQLVVACMATVQTARRERGDWHAARYLLGQQGYGEKTSIEHSGDVGGHVQVYVVDVEDEKA